jgi:RNase P protein component
MASSSHSLHDKKNHAYLCAHVKNASSVSHHDSCYDQVVLRTRHDVFFDSHAMFASSSSTHAHCRNRHRRYIHHVVSRATRN